MKRIIMENCIFLAVFCGGGVLFCKLTSLAFIALGCA